MKAKNLILHCAFSLKLCRWIRGKVHNFTAINIIEVILSPLGLLKFLAALDFKLTSRPPNQRCLSQ